MLRANDTKAIVVVLAAVTGLSVSGQTRNVPCEWRDYGGGPDSSRFVAATQIDKSNVARLQVAWTYPSGQTDFNPLVVRGVIYGRRPNDSFVAVDAATGKEIWAHKDVQGFNTRGMNYWESADGKDRRLARPLPAAGLIPVING
jgi:quinoprotein glucose dehydrogenase